MATHLISFRIAHDSSATDRWGSTVSAIHLEAKDGLFWEETTSLVILKSDKSADSLASSIYCGSTFDVSKDKLLVVDVERNVQATRGKIDYPASLAYFFPSNALLRSLLS